MDDDPPHGSPALDRRGFLRLGAAASAGLLAGGLRAPVAAALPDLPANPRTPGAMPTRNLGRTGYRVGAFSLGGQAAIELPNNDAIAVPLIERALDLGVNYLDTAPAYGASQQYIGQVMKHRRREAFLASKTNDYTRDGALRLLEQSLRLLQTDHLDLWQLHNLERMDELGKIFGAGGAIEALLRAREQKLVRFLGVTGHAEPRVLMEALRRFDFDTLLLALNAADPHHASFAKKLLPMAVERELGIIGMKIPARGRLLSSWTPSADRDDDDGVGPQQRGKLAMREALYYVLSLPVSTVIVGCDSIGQLEENVALARTFTPLSPSQMHELTVRAKPIARQALFFRRWS